MLCASCGVLVGVNDDTCYNCGRRNPALWGFAPALRELGVGVQVDDFGTGYSSLASLHRFDLTALKIDRRFVDNLGRAPASSSVVQAILALAEALKLEVIAEGVETEPQRRTLLDLGCSVGQGFLFAPALSPAEATRLWRQGGGVRTS